MSSNKLQGYNLFVVVDIKRRICAWSFATNRSSSWKRFEAGCQFVSKKQAKKDGFQCIRVNIFEVK